MWLKRSCLATCTLLLLFKTSIAQKGQKGEAGATGATGVYGPPGPAGIPGQRGEPGPPGPIGPSGPYGARGRPGVSGPTGLRGEAGEAGPSGPVGPRGAPGARGEPGPQGNRGEQGNTGAPGPRGFEGRGGQNGARGNPGPRGPQGPRGERGEVGRIGPAGPRGSLGSPGPRGDVGLRGEPGPSGPAGGRTGETGYTGPSGSTGATGQSGTKGDVGPTGFTGPAGPVGPQGPPGPPGPEPSLEGLLPNGIKQWQEICILASMILHALTLGGLLMLTIAFCSMHKQNKKMHKTFQMIKHIKGEDNSGYLIPNNNLQTMLRIGTSNGSSSDDSGIAVEDGYAHIGAGKTANVSTKIPPDPPSLLHRNNTYLNPDEEGQNISNQLKSPTYLDIIQGDQNTSSENVNTGSYEQLPSGRNNVEKPHNYQQLKQVFEQGRTKSSLKYEKLAGEREPSIKHDYNKLYQQKRDEEPGVQDNASSANDSVVGNIDKKAVKEENKP